MKIFISIREWTPSHVELSNMHYTERGKITPTMYAYELEMEDDGESWWDNTMCAYLSRVASRYAKKGTLHSMLESKGAKLDYAKELFKSFTDFYTNKLEESAGSAESVINELSEDFILSIMLGDGGSALKGKGEDLSRLFIGQDIEVYKEHLEAKKRAIHYINKGTSYPLFTIIAPLLKVYFLKV